MFKQRSQSLTTRQRREAYVLPSTFLFFIHLLDGLGPVCFSEIQNGLAFWYRLALVVPDKGS